MRVCSGCLATDGRLFDIREGLLEQAFAELTGLAESGGSLSLCVVCLQLLRKFSDFRARCLRSRRALQQLSFLNPDNFIQIDRTHLKHNLNRTDIIFISCDSVETENLNTNLPHNVTVPPGGHSDTTIIQDYIKSAENDCSAKENPMKIETYRIKNENTFDNQTEIHIDILDNTKFSCNNDLTNPIDDIKYENECTQIDDITIETDASKYESLGSDEETIKEKSQAFENYNDETSSNAGDNDDDFGIFEQKSNKKLKQLSPNEKTIVIEVSQLFRSIWRRVIKDDGNIYEMFERLYKVSLDPKLDAIAVGSRTCKSKNRTEKENLLSFVSMYKKVADINNVSIEFFSIEAERLAMDSRRQSADARQCALCCRVFNTADTRRRHEERFHNESLPYRCLVCMYTFKKQTLYLLHLLKVHATRKTCKECGLNIAMGSQKSHWDEVHKHVDEVHRKALVHCQYCDRSFTFQRHCYSHIRKEHRAQMNAVQCLLCGDSYNGRFGLRSHVVRMHPTAVKCGGCAVWFANEAARSAHAVDGDCRKDLSGCPMCGCTFPTERFMRDHYDDTHALNKCSNCNLTFIELKSYKEHYYRMCNDGLGAQRFPRAQNNKAQKKPPNNIKKKKQYKKKDSYICDVCGKGCDSAADLRYHQRLHTGEKPYKCKHCGRAFRQGATLYVHMWTHTGERRYKCKLCPKAFRQSQHLKAHMPSHTNEKKYACTLCSKRFTSSATLRHHARTVHEGLSPHRRNRQKKKPLDVNDSMCT